MNFETIGDYIQEGFDELSENSATACAAGAVIGVGVTAFLSGRAAVNAQYLDKSVSRKKRILDTIKNYAPPVISGLVTSGLIIASDRLHVKETLEMGAIAAMWKQNYADLERKVEEKLGSEECEKIEKEIISERAENKEPSQVIPSDSILLWEPITEQYIVIKKEAMAMAFLDFNENLFIDRTASLNELLDLLGGNTNNPIGDAVGWSEENSKQIVQSLYYGVPYVRPQTEFRISPGETKCNAFTLRFNIAPQQIDGLPF